MEPLKTFIIYASADRGLRAELEHHLQPLVDLNWLSLWSDKEILPGEIWDNAIKRGLQQSDLFLLLVSSDFFSSEYIRAKEFRIAIERLRAGHSIVIPIIVRPCFWKSSPIIKDLQVLPPGGYAVTDADHWKDREKSNDKAWSIVVESIEGRVKILRVQRQAEEKKHFANLLGEQKEKSHKRDSHSNTKAVQTDSTEKQSQPNEHSSTKQPWRQDKKFSSKQTLRYSSGSVIAIITIWLVMKNCFKEIDGTIVQSHPASTDTAVNQSIHQPPLFDSLPISSPLKHEKKSGLEMVPVKGGNFMMGQNDSNLGGAGYSGDETPLHFVVIASFKIGRHELTQADWREIMGSDPMLLNFKGCDECPVEGVSWYEVQDFIQKLNAKTGKRYRLPTEEEWEFAARGGNNSKNFKYPGGNNLDSLAWYGHETIGSRTHPVGKKKPNELGLFDMAGNVWEWCASDYAPYPDSKYKLKRQGYKVARGGAWDYSKESYYRSTKRWPRHPKKPYLNVGFRIAHD